MSTAATTRRLGRESCYGMGLPQSPLLGQRSKRRWVKQALGGAFSTVRQTLGAAGRGARHISEHSGQHRGGISELAAAGASQSDLSANLRKITALVSAPRQPRAHTECRGHRCHHLLLAGATPRP